MRRLTTRQLADAFMASGFSSDEISTYWVILERAYTEDGIELRDALLCVREQTVEVSVFVGHILQPADLDDVVHVIDRLAADVKNRKIWSSDCLPPLRAWRAKVLMQIVID